jgi:archaellum component FlaC
MDEGRFQRSTRVQSDILKHVQESRARLETEIRKLLHEVTRIAEQALAHAKKLRKQGVPGNEVRLLARKESYKPRQRTGDSRFHF